MSDTVTEYINSNQKELIKLLKEMIAVPSVRGVAAPNQPYGEGPAAALSHFLSAAEKMGFKTQNHENYMGTVDYGDYEKTPALGILCHLDVVPAGQGWASNPFNAVLKNGRIYGRGASDDKGPAVCALYALRALKESGAELPKGVRLIVGCDEECGSSDLAYYKKKEKLPQMLFSPDAGYPVINIEKGILRTEFSLRCLEEKYIHKLHAGSVVNAVPALGGALVSSIPHDALERARTECEAACPNITFDITFDSRSTEIAAHGVGAHASTPELGANALTALVTLLCRAFEIAGITDSPAATALKTVCSMFPHGDSTGSAFGIACSDKESGALSCALSVMSFESEMLRFKTDIRYPVCRNLREMSAAVMGSFTKHGVKSFELKGVEPHKVSAKSNLVKKLIAAYEAETGEKGYAYAIGGGTYVHDTEGGVAFGAEFPGEENNIHGADESVSVESLMKNVKIFARAVEELCK